MSTPASNTRSHSRLRQQGTSSASSEADSLSTPASNTGSKRSVGASADNHDYVDNAMAITGMPLAWHLQLEVRGIL